MLKTNHIPHWDHHFCSLDDWILRGRELSEKLLSEELERKLWELYVKAAQKETADTHWITFLIFMCEL